MKKYKTFILLFIILLISLQSIAATNVFLTSDSIGSTDNDKKMLNSVKDYIEELSNGTIKVTIDPNAPGPGEGTRALQSSADVSVAFAACCAGNFLELAKGLQNQNKEIIFVNTGDFDLDNKDYIRRAWDDNYSSVNFAGINKPGTFLREMGIDYIQPVKEYSKIGESYTSSDDEVNKYIAEQIVQKINNKSNTKTYDESLIVTHKLHPSVMAKASKELVKSESTEYNKTYNSIKAPQLLYLTSSYLSGSSLSEAANYEYPDNPWQYSFFTKGSYSIYDYMQMAGIVKNYMDENKKAPEYINYNGAIISYYDLTYNFAKITQNHTDMENMDFSSSYSFEKVHHSMLIDSIPFIAFGIILLAIYAIIRKMRRKRRYR